MRLLRVAIISLLLVGCSSETEEQRQIRHEHEEVQGNVLALSRHLQYYKDVNKNVCYAGAFIGYNFGTFTYVPCTPEIERTAHQFNSNQTVR